MGLTQPPIEWVLGAVSLTAKQPFREVNKSPPFSAEVKNMWRYKHTPRLHTPSWRGSLLIQYRHNLSLNSCTT